MPPTNDVDAIKVRYADRARVKAMLCAQHETTVADLVAEVEALRSQRDDLLAALKAILAERPELWGDFVHDGVTDFPISEDALFAADEAIKKVVGH